MFVRKLYFDAETGAVVRSSMMQGHVRLTTLEEDLAALPELAAYVDTPDTLGVMVWGDPDPAVEDCMSRATGISVDVTQDPPVVVYDYTPIDLPEPEDALVEARAILRGEVEVE